MTWGRVCLSPEVYGTCKTMLIQVMTMNLTCQNKTDLIIRISFIEIVPYGTKFLILVGHDRIFNNAQ